jgi:hypothetical protein
MAPFFAANTGPTLLEAINWTSRHLYFMHGKANSLLKGSLYKHEWWGTAED